MRPSKMDSQVRILNPPLQVILTFSFALLGGCCGAGNKKTVIGGWAWAWAFVTDVQA